MRKHIKPPVRYPMMGDIVRYIYMGEWEYARWTEDNTRILLGVKRPDAHEIIQGVWKKGQWHSRKIIKPNQP